MMIQFRHYHSMMQKLSVLIVAQALVQALALVSGILILRSLDKGSYALYALCAGLTASFGPFADLNTSTSVATFGATMRGDPRRLHVLMCSANQIRVATILLATILLTFSFALTSQKFSLNFSYQGLSLILMVATIMAQQGVNIAYALFNSQFLSHKVQISSAVFALIRLFLTIIILASIAEPIWLIAGNAIAAMMQWFHSQVWLRKIVPGAVHQAEEVQKARREILKFIAPLVMTTIYYALQGNLPVLLSSFFGTASKIADTSALTRFSLLFAVLGMANNMIFLPKLASETNLKRLKQHSLYVISFAIFSGAMILLCAYLFPSALLLIVGTQYSGLQTELVTALLGSYAWYLAGTLFICTSSQKATAGQQWTVLFATSTQVACFFLLGAETVESVLLIATCGGSSMALSQFIVYMRYIKKSGTK
jgi:O-antigen/teichoic acid export membrane protein